MFFFLFVTFLNLFTYHAIQEEQFTVLEIEQAMEGEMDEVPEVVQTANKEANENQKSLSQASSQETTQSSPARIKPGLATPTFPFTYEFSINFFFYCTYLKLFVFYVKGLAQADLHKFLMQVNHQPSPLILTQNQAPLAFLALEHRMRCRRSRHGRTSPYTECTTET